MTLPIDDFTLLENLKKDIDSFPKDGKPFAVYAMTMDTHWPSGYVSRQCGTDSSNVKSEKDKYRNALLCASKNAWNFLEWAKQQDWFDNTVIVIQGDHYMPGILRDLMETPKTDPYLWYNVFINVDKPIDVNRKFSGFDMLPTIIESIGGMIDGHRIALGTSLLAENRDSTLLEIMGMAKLDSLLELDDEMDLYLTGLKKK